jgi:hypothetical protein
MVRCPLLLDGLLEVVGEIAGIGVGEGDGRTLPGRVFAF